MKTLLIIGANGAIGKALSNEANDFYENIIEVDMIFNNSVKVPKIKRICLDLSNNEDIKSLKEEIINIDSKELDIIFAQRPFLQLKPNSDTADIFNAIEISLIASIKIIELLVNTNTLKKVIFLGSINSEFVCDQPLSYMVAKASCDTAVKFLSKKYKDVIFINFIIGLVNVKSKKNNFQNSLKKLQAGKSATGGNDVPNDFELASTVFKIMQSSTLLLSGSKVYVDNGQHYTDSFWSARLTNNFND